MTKFYTVLFERTSSGHVALREHDIEMDPAFVPSIGDKIYSEREHEPVCFRVVDRFLDLGQTGERIYGASLVVERVDETMPS